MSTASAVAFSALFFANCVLTVCAASDIFRVQNRVFLNANHPIGPILRGGDIEQSDVFDISTKPTPPIDFAHGTTTLSFVFQGGIVAAVDSRAR
jgi:hypothetical protein